MAQSTYESARGVLAGLIPEGKSSDVMVREIRGDEPMSLRERIEDSCRMIGKMCAQGRPPAMSVPAQSHDEDVFIIDTLIESLSEINQLEAEVARLAAERDALRKLAYIMRDAMPHLSALVDKHSVIVDAWAEADKVMREG